MPRTRRTRRNGNQYQNQEANQALLHPCARTTAGATSTNITRTDLGLLSDRPCRPDHLTITFYSSEARSFNLTVLGGNAEQVYRSPIMIAGPIPLTRSFALPKNTDYALFAAAAQVVIQANHASGVTIRFAFNLRCSYKTAAISGSQF
jgi:hypothetical protein